MNGNQTAGRKKRSSEALLHLEIYKARPEIKSVVHCHPPHATAFAIAREPIFSVLLKSRFFWAMYRSHGMKHLEEKHLLRRFCRL